MADTNFNSNKCKVLSLGPHIVNTYSMSYPDGLHQLIRVEEEEKALVMLFSSTLKFSHYVKEMVHHLRLTRCKDY